MIIIAKFIANIKIVYIYVKLVGYIRLQNIETEEKNVVKCK